MHAMKHVIFLCVAGVLLTSGCASTRVVTDLKPESDPALKSPAGQFYVAGLKYGDAEGSDGPRTAEWNANYGKRLLPLVRNECIARYPLLFAQDSANSIPLWLEVSGKRTQHQGKFIAWMLGTLYLSPLIFPTPMIQDDRDIGVTVGLWNGHDGMGSGTIRREFRREEHAWFTIYTPWGLMKMSGESDFPKVSKVMSNGRDIDSVPQVAQQIATAIAKLIAPKDPAFWTAPAQEPATPAQGQGATGALPALPTALPLPTEPAAPF